MFSGKFSAYPLYLKSAHDPKVNRKLFIDRPLDNNHVQALKKSALEFPGRALTAGALLGIYDGSVKDFITKNSDVGVQLMRRKRPSSNVGWSYSTKQTAGNVLCPVCMSKNDCMCTGM